MSKKLTPESIYQAKISLRNIRPPIWRRFLLRADLSLSDLHIIIQTAMDWEGYHLHAFTLKNKGRIVREFEAGEEESTRLYEVLKREGAKLCYTYDFGDSWDHEILLQKILPSDPTWTHPVCLAGKRAAPPEDCGGAWNYGWIMEVLEDASHPEYGEISDLHEGLDPGRFSKEEINQRLAKIWKVVDSGSGGAKPASGRKAVSKKKGRRQVRQLELVPADSRARENGKEEGESGSPDGLDRLKALMAGYSNETLQTMVIRLARSLSEAGLNVFISSLPEPEMVDFSGRRPSPFGSSGPKSMSELENTLMDLFAGALTSGALGMPDSPPGFTEFLGMLSYDGSEEGDEWFDEDDDWDEDDDPWDEDDDPWDGMENGGALEDALESKELANTLAIANRAFEEGDKPRALLFYSMLFSTIAEVNQECLEPVPLEQLERLAEGNLREAMWRYLRILYEWTSPKDRPAVLMSVSDALPLQKIPILQALGRVSGDRLPALKKFLPAWIALLRSRFKRPDRRDAYHRKMLVEALLLHGKEAEIKKMAKRHPSESEGIYFDWIDCLAWRKAYEEGAARAMEHMRKARTAESRAEFADLAAWLYKQRGDQVAALEARRQAWRASPNLLRLLALRQEATTEEQEALLAVEHQAIERQEVAVPPRLASLLALFIGREATAFQLAASAPGTGWAAPGHPGPVVVPFLLLAVSRTDALPVGSEAARFWSGFGMGIWMPRQSTSLSFLPAVTQQWMPVEWDCVALRLNEELEDRNFVAWQASGQILRSRLQVRPLSAEDWQRAFEALQTVTRTRVMAILKGKRRKDYSQAASLVVAFEEVTKLADASGGAKEFFLTIQRDTSRFTIFKREFFAIRARSPVL